uniref:Uncharacterized protein n=1 Tax=Calidris pygmaea TaxID=425635 RepID=A0A8C3JPP9_9CHAR
LNDHVGSKSCLKIQHSAKLLHFLLPSTPAVTPRSAGCPGQGSPCCGSSRGRGTGRAAMGFPELEPARRPRDKLSRAGRQLCS